MSRGTEEPDDRPREVNINIGGSGNPSFTNSGDINHYGSPPPKFACPVCRQADQLQKVSTVVEAGTVTAQHDPWAARETSRMTNLASRLSPPPPVVDHVLWRRLPYALLAMSLLVLAACVIPTLSGEESFEGTPPALSIICLLVFAVPCLLSWKPLKQRHAALVNQAEAREEILQRWQALYYCHRDDVVFDVDRPERYVRSGEMERLIDPAVPTVPPLEHPDVIQLLQQATESMNYGAVQDLHQLFSRAAPPDRLWDWWLDRTQEAAEQGDRDIAALAIDFARTANVDPWGPLRYDHYDRMKSIERI